MFWSNRSLYNDRQQNGNNIAHEKVVVTTFIFLISMTIDTRKGFSKLL